MRHNATAQRARRSESTLKATGCAERAHSRIPAAVHVRRVRGMEAAREMSMLSCKLIQTI